VEVLGSNGDEVNAAYADDCEGKGSAPGEIRTHGPRIRNPVLYPTELRGHMRFQQLT
jgi:hypothetical protein